MRTLSARQLRLAGVTGTIGTAVLVLTALQYDKLPFLNAGRDYSAFFAETAGMTSGAPVEISGIQVGEVSGVAIDGNRVKVSFTINDDVTLGERTEAAIKTKTLLGARVLAVTPRGSGALTATIPIERTTSPYLLPDALGELSTTIDGIDTEQLSQSLTSLSGAFQNTPPALKAALTGVARFSETVNARDAQLRRLLTSVHTATSVLAQRSGQLSALVEHANYLLAALAEQGNALDSLAERVSALSRQLSGVVADNREQLRPALDKLNGVLTIVDNRKSQIQESVKLLNKYALALGETVGTGPYFKAYIANLVGGQFIQPFVDAAFSDLGLDPNVKLPSELVDPPTGQPGTPPLPTDYPRTGQGGPPRLTLPDAITGTHGDPRYPYREPVPAPPPGGPPPGPPGPGVPPAPAPTDVLWPAPGVPAEPGPPAPAGETP